MGLADTFKKTVILEIVGKTNQSMKKLNKDMKETATQVSKTGRHWSTSTKRMAANRREANKVIKANDGLWGSLGLNMEQFKLVNTYGKGYNTTLGKMGNKVRMMTHGMRGFKMEMLGVMFFGMGMVRLFSGLLKPSANLFGIFELWGTLLEIVFLPIMTLLFDKFMEFFEWVLTWDEDTKMFVGTLVLFGLVLGGFLMLFGMIALGVGSVILAFGAFLPITGIVMGVFVGLGLLVVGVVKIIQGKLEGIGLVIMGIGFILIAFIGWWALISIAVGAAIYFIIKHWDRVKLFFKTLWIDIKIIFFKGLMGIATMFFNNALIKFIMDKMGWSGVIGATAGIVTALEEEKALIISQYETQQALKDTAEESKKTGSTISDSISSMVSTSKDGNKDMSNSFMDGFTKSNYVVEEKMSVMAGGYKETLGEMLVATKTKVTDINSELGKIGNSSGSSSSRSSSSLATTGIYSDAFGKAMIDGRAATGDEIAQDLGLHDFIWRPGQAPTKIDPGDSIIGTKGGMSGNGVTINQTNNINVSDKAEMERLIESNNRKIVDDLSRLTRTPV